MLAIYDSLRHQENFTGFAIQGKENNRTSFTLQMTYAEFVEYFKAVPYDPNADLLLQRETQGSRISAIYQYAKMDYAALPSCGAIVENLAVEPLSFQNLVKLTIPATSFRYLFDGQGRLAGIKRLLEKEQGFKDNTVSIKVYLTEGVEKDNQLFSDWNGSQNKPNASICMSMDSRKIINTFAKRILKSPNMSVFNSRIDYTKASVTLSSSPKLWSLNQFTTFVQLVLGVTAKSAETLLSDEEKQESWQGFIVKYINELQKLEAFGEGVRSDECVAQLKENSVIGTAVWLKAMAITGKIIALHLMQNTPSGQQADWSCLQTLNDVDFSKTNREWIGRCMDYRGRFQDKGFNHKAMAAYLLAHMGIELPEELEIIEDEVLLAKAENRKKQREEEKQQGVQLTLVEAS